MQEHIRFLLGHAIKGAIAGVAFVILICVLDVARIWSMASHTDGGFLALAVTTVFFIITFSSVQMGIAVMSLGRDDDR